MNTILSDKVEAHRGLFETLIDGPMTEDAERELAARLKTDPLLRRAYVRYLETHSLLYWELNRSEPQSIKTSAAESGARQARARRRRHPRVRTVGMLSAAAVFVLCVTAWWLIEPEAPPATPARPPQPVTEPAASLTHIEGGQWASDSVAHAGQTLYPDRLTLRGGSAQLVFYGGALVDLAGPCDFEIIHKNRGYLRRGALAATLIADSRGFTIQAPGGLEVVDLGTRFDMSVEDGDQTNVHVLEGRVELRWPDRQWALRAGQSARWAPHAGQTADLQPVDTYSLQTPSYGAMTLVRAHYSDSEIPRADGNNTFPTSNLDQRFTLPKDTPWFESHPRWNYRDDPLVRLPGVGAGFLHGWNSDNNLIPITTRFPVPFGTYDVCVVYAVIDSTGAVATGAELSGGVRAALSGQMLTQYDHTQGVLLHRSTPECAVYAGYLGQVVGNELSVDLAQSRLGNQKRTMYVGIAYNAVNDKSSHP